MVGDVSFRRSTTEKKPTNNQKCLLVGSRSVSTKCRHLLTDLAGLLPHARTHAKIDIKKEGGDELMELCNLHRCNTFCFLEARKRETAFLWFGQIPNGPSIKVQLFNVHTASELRMAGNCLKYSRPLLHFDKEFDVIPHLRILKALLTDVFNTPNYHPKSKPFIDHMLCFFYLDGKIWFRNYQILPDSQPTMDVMEIGPRFVMDPVVVLNGNLQGSVLWRNDDAVAPSEQRKSKAIRALKKNLENKYVQKKSIRHREVNPAPEADPLSKIFNNEDSV